MENPLEAPEVHFLEEAQVAKQVLRAVVHLTRQLEGTSVQGAEGGMCPGRPAPLPRQDGHSACPGDPGGWTEEK